MLLSGHVHRKENYTFANCGSLCEEFKTMVDGEFIDDEFRGTSRSHKQRHSSG